jgi:predicted RNA polymerase sigma factor
VAWLVATGRNRAIDRVRRERTLQDKARLLRVDQPTATMDEIDLDDSTIPDERLELIFTCCHPALAIEAQVALTLRALGGLTTEEIARAFLVSEETMKRRLSRAKAKIKVTAIPFAVPADPLAEQYRSRHDRAKVKAGRAALERALALRAAAGPYVLQAAIAEAGAPDRALELVDSLELGDYRYLHSTRAELLRRLGRQEEARAAFQHALRLAATDPERRFLARRLAGL